MGNTNFKNLTKEMLDEYATLTYLSKSEIVNIYKKFRSLGPEEVDNWNIERDPTGYRFPAERILEIFPAITFNPFKERILQVFCSEQNGYYSFEDVLDLCSVMSDNCPDDVKASWAFKIYDFDDDFEEGDERNRRIGKEDILELIDRLLYSPKNSYTLTDAEKETISNELISAINIQKTGAISEQEFKHAVGKMTEFSQSFRFHF